MALGMHEKIAPKLNIFGISWGLPPCVIQF